MRDNVLVIFFLFRSCYVVKQTKGKDRSKTFGRNTKQSRKRELGGKWKVKDGERVFHTCDRMRHVGKGLRTRTKYSHGSGSCHIVTLASTHKNNNIN